MNNRFECNKICRRLVRRTKEVLYRAMRVLLANLRFVCVGVFRMYRMRVSVQFQQQRVWHHYSSKEQEQQHSDMSQIVVHPIVYN